MLPARAVRAHAAHAQESAQVGEDAIAMLQGVPFVAGCLESLVWYHLWLGVPFVVIFLVGISGWWFGTCFFSIYWARESSS